MIYVARFHMSFCNPIIIGFFSTRDLADTAGKQYIIDTETRWNNKNHNRELSYDICEIVLDKTDSRFCGWMLDDKEDGG